MWSHWIRLRGEPDKRLYGRSKKGAALLRQPLCHYRLVAEAVVYADPFVMAKGSSLEVGLVLTK